VFSSGPSAWLLVMTASSFQYRCPWKKKSPILPCSHQVIPQGSKSTHWQKWSGRSGKMHLSTALAQAHIIGSNLSPGCKISIFWACSSESFPNSFVVQRQTPFSPVLFQVFLASFRSIMSHFRSQSLCGTHDMHSLTWWPLLQSV